MPGQGNESEARNQFLRKKMEMENKSCRDSYDENRRHDSFTYPKLNEKRACQAKINELEWELRRIDYYLSNGQTTPYKLF